MIITKQQYEIFKEECLYWLDKFHLNDYDVYFEFKELDNADARSSISGDCGNITIALSNELDFFQYKPIERIKELAKHEILHCLLGKFSNSASERYISENELISEEEHLVRKLVKIIK